MKQNLIRNINKILNLLNKLPAITKEEIEVKSDIRIRLRELSDKLKEFLEENNTIRKEKKNENFPL